MSKSQGLKKSMGKEQWSVARGEFEELERELGDEQNNTVIFFKEQLL